MAPENLRLLGKLSKLHAFEGEAILIAEWSFSKKDSKTEWVFIIIDGLPVPFFISSFRIRSDNSAIIKLNDVNGDKEMQPLIGLEVFVDDKKKKAINRKDSDVDGYLVIDKNLGLIGQAKTVLNYKQNFLLQVFRDGNEILIPVNETIILGINDSEKTIETHLPEGFMEIYG